MFKQLAFTSLITVDPCFFVSAYSDFELYFSIPWPGEIMVRWHGTSRKPTICQTMGYSIRFQSKNCFYSWSTAWIVDYIECGAPFGDRDLLEIIIHIILSFHTTADEAPFMLQTDASLLFPIRMFVVHGRSVCSPDSKYTSFICSSFFTPALTRNLGYHVVLLSRFFGPSLELSLHTQANYLLGCVTSTQFKYVPLFRGEEHYLSCHGQLSSKCSSMAC